MKNKIIALGFFDSIHLGHRALIEKGKELANKTSSDFCVTTFSDDFLKLINKANKEVYLLAERKEILNNLGVNNLFVFDTTPEFFNMSKDSFLEYISTFLPTGIVVGNDYKFGKNAEGTVEDILAYFENKNVPVKVCNLVQVGEKKISTNDIREYLTDGEIEKANKLLGERFFYSGIVTHGKKNGTKMGYPTINVEIPDGKIKIKSGVYSSYTYVGTDRYLSVTNVGGRPTLNDKHFNVETHLVDVNQDLYGEKVRIEIISFLRDIKKFDNLKELSLQIEKDVETTKRMYL